MNKEDTIQKRKGGIETKNKILEQASNLFASKGFHAVPMREIAQAVGIKESSIYNHFKSKEDILESLFQLFIEGAPLSRPSDQELEKMMLLMGPEEIFKNILFHVGSHVSDTLANAAQIINYEKFRNARAAEIYYKHVVDEPTGYYERLITKMKERGMVKTDNARIIAEQYNYVSIVLTKEYFMAKSGLTDLHKVIKYMIKTIEFYCALMKP